MPTPISKTFDNTQFGRVSDAAGASPLGAAAADDGLAPLVDSHGRLIVVPFSGGPLPSNPLLRADSMAVVLAHQAKASAGSLYQAWGMQVASAATLFIQFYDLAAGPPAGIMHCAPLPALQNGLWSVAFPEGLAFANGILIALSTTAMSYTIPGTGGWFTALYR